jgi:AmiR/NasT family two-component response regulator
MQAAIEALHQGTNQRLIQVTTPISLRQARAFAIQAAITDGLQPHHLQEYEKLAHLDFCARRRAAKKCRKLRMGAIPFSDAIKKARDGITRRCQ